MIGFVNTGFWRTQQDQCGRKTSLPFLVPLYGSPQVSMRKAASTRCIAPAAAAHDQPAPACVLGQVSLPPQVRMCLRQTLPFHRRLNLSLEGGGPFPEFLVPSWFTFFQSGSQSCFLPLLILFFCVHILAMVSVSLLNTD